MMPSTASNLTVLGVRFTGNRATWPHSFPWGPAQYIYADGGQ
jgi:hypothetical protein